LIARLAESSSSVHTVVLSSASASLRPEFAPDTLLGEARQAATELGIPETNVQFLDFPVRDFPQHRQAILEELVRIRADINPDLVILPCTTDIHQDHATIHHEGIRAFKSSTILGYEMVWNSLGEHCQLFVSLDKEHLSAKEHALGAYVSQRDRAYMGADFVRSLARVRGVAAGCEYAEAYEVIRWSI